MPAYKKPKPKWPWRDFLTPAEAKTLAKIDAARAKWESLLGARAGITNRAIQRAKYAAGIKR